MFGFLGYSSKVAGALYEIGITGVPPHRIDQTAKTVICDAAKKKGYTPEEAAVVLYSKYSNISQHSLSDVINIVDGWVLNKKVSAPLWEDIIRMLE